VDSGPYSVVAADVTGDGKADLISAKHSINDNGHTLTVWINNVAVFASKTTLDVDPGPYSVVAADVSGDGKLDLISANKGVCMEAR